MFIYHQAGVSTTIVLTLSVNFDQINGGLYCWPAKGIDLKPKQMCVLLLSLMKDMIILFVSIFLLPREIPMLSDLASSTIGYLYGFTFTHSMLLELTV